MNIVQEEIILGIYSPLKNVLESVEANLLACSSSISSTEEAQWLIAWEEGLAD